MRVASLETRAATPPMTAVSACDVCKWDTKNIFRNKQLSGAGFFAKTKNVSSSIKLLTCRESAHFSLVLVNLLQAALLKRSFKQGQFYEEFLVSTRASYHQHTVLTLQYQIVKCLKLLITFSPHDSIIRETLWLHDIR